MSFVSILETLLIGPLKLLFELIFNYAYTFLKTPAGVAIIVLSLVMNILVLPLYKRADAMQEEARDIDKKLQKGVSHIKKSFSGDEKMMILQTYYRQNNYKPTDALKGSVSLLLEIPFFMAAYQFLSNVDALNGASLGPIKDLGAPDGLLVIGGLSINLLPILMTVINIISSTIYLKGFPVKTKIQLYAVAFFFLVFLYTSPSGLVFYWTLNNIFSLVKNIFYKLKNPKKVLRIILSVIGAVFIAFGAFFYKYYLMSTTSLSENSYLIDDISLLKRKLFIIAIGILLLIPLIFPVIKSKIKFNFNFKFKTNKKTIQPNKKLFLAGSVFLTVLVGLIVSSTFIAASPQEFVDITYFHNPLWYIVSTFCMAAGTFLIWFRVFYWLATPKGKVLFDKLVWIFSGVMITNYMFFGNNLGIISPSLKYEDGLNFSKKEQIINIVVIFVVVVVFYFIVTKWSKLATGVLLSAVIALGAMSAVNIVKINASINSINISDTSSTPHFKLSKEGQNVVVLLLDRAMGEFVPYIINEKPELKEQFDGFTYYSNTISHGGFTNFCAPSVLGGYEYTPVELNKRDSELLVDKHNEALKVMPKLFNSNNYEVTVCDAPYANYKPIADLSIYNDTPEINKYLTKGKFSDETQKAQSISHNHRNFFCFSLMKTLPVSLQPSLYQEGMYRRLFYANDTNYSTPNIKSRSVAVGYDKSFMNSYDVLKNLNNITEISNHNENTFLFLYNDLTHDPILLQTPEYEPEYEVDNTKYDAEHADRFTVNGNSINMDNLEQLMHYHCNMGAFVQIGKWLDYLKENDVYDNTRIIIVSDHGKPIKCMDSLILDDGTDEYKNVEYYYPLFLVKDFNATGFTTSDEFMTNADVPYLATKDLIENPVNPFTGKEISIDEKTSHEQLVIMSDYWGVDLNNGYTFFPAKWASVSENLWDKNNWKFYDEKIVLKDYKLPES